MSNIPGLCATLAVILTAEVANVGAAEQTRQPAALLLGSSAERAGDLPALEREWWAVLEGAPESPVAQTMLALWPTSFAHLPQSAASVERWRALDERMRTNGWSRRLVRNHLYQALRGSGKLRAAAAIPRWSDVPRRWIGVGPFGRFRATALHRTFPPELSFDEGAQYPGTRSPVSWRDVVIAREHPHLNPNEAWGRRGAVYYFRSRVAVTAAVPALLEVESPASFRLWLDDLEVLTGDRHRELLPRRLRVGAKLGAGAHTILLKTDGGDLTLRLLDPQGFPLAFEELDPWGANSPNPRIEVDSTISPRGLAVFDGFREWHHGSLAENRWLPLALGLLHEGDSLGCRRLLLAAEESDFDATTIALAAERAAPGIGYLSGDWKRSWLARLRASALAEDPNTFSLRIATAREQFTDDRPIDALRTLEPLLEPGNPSASLSALLLADEIYEQRSWFADRRRVLDRLEAMAPHHPETLIRFIRRWESEKRPAAALPYRAELFRRRPTLARGVALADAYASCGRMSEARTLLDSWDLWGGTTAGSLRARLELLQRWEREDEALEVLRELTRRRPDDSTLQTAIGDAHWRAGRLTDAAAAYQRSLSLRPGQIRLLARLRALAGPEDEAPPFWQPYARETQIAIDSAPPPGEYPNAAAVYLIDQLVTRVGPEGGREEMVHQLVRLDSQQAVDSFSTLSVPGEVIELRVLTPAGRELHPTAGSAGSAYTLPGLTPGAFVEYRSLVRRDLEDARGLTLGPFFFRDPDYAAAFHLSELVVLLPRDWSVTVRERRVSRTVDRIQGELRELVWRVVAADRQDREFLAPPRDHTLPNVVVFHPGEWSETLRGIAERAAVPDYVTPEIEQAAATITEGCSSTRERLNALYEAVSERVKSATSFGDNAASVWLNRSGDRDLLLASLLRAAAIPFDRVFAAKKDALLPEVDWTLPNAGLFAFPFLRVPIADEDTEVFVTAASRWAPLGQIPVAQQGARGVRVAGSDTHWLTMPSAPRHADAQLAELSFDVSGGAPVQLRGVLEQRQWSASLSKDPLLNLDPFQRTTQLERFVQQFFPGATLTAGDFPDLDNRDKPFRMTFELEDPNLLEQPAGDARLKVLPIPSRLKQRFIRKAERVEPFWSRSEQQSIDRIRIELGERYRVAKLPEDFDAIGPWGQYRLCYRVRGTEVHVERYFELIPFQLEPSEFASFMAFCTQVDRQEEERLRLERKSP